jgi:hypothetical protein
MSARRASTASSAAGIMMAIFVLSDAIGRGEFALANQARSAWFG